MATTWPETAGVTRTPKGCQQWQKNIRQVICGNAKWHALKKAKPPISSGNPKSVYSDMEVFTDCKRFWVVRLVRDSRSREGKPARDWDKPKEWCCSSASYSSCIIYRKKQNNAGISPGLSGRNGEKAHEAWNTSIHVDIKAFKKKLMIKRSVWRFCLTI